MSKALTRIDIVGFGGALGASEDRSMDDLISDAVDVALESAGLTLAEIGTVVANGNDGDDGLLTPLIRAEAAGAANREYIQISGDYLRALTSGLALIAGGLAGTTLVVGWCPADNSGENQRAEMLADPFFLRPLAATPANLRRLQAVLLGTKPVEESQDQRAGAVAVILRASSRVDRGMLCIADWGTAFRPYWPGAEDLDPAQWAAEAMEGLGKGRIVASGISLPGATVMATEEGATAPQWVRGGFDLIGLIEDMRGAEPDVCVFVTAAGPLGQSVTALQLERTG